MSRSVVAALLLSHLVAIYATSADTTTSMESTTTAMSSDVATGAEVCQSASTFTPDKVAQVECMNVNASTCSMSPCSTEWDEGKCVVRGMGNLTQCCVDMNGAPDATSCQTMANAFKTRSTLDCATNEGWTGAYYLAAMSGMHCCSNGRSACVAAAEMQVCSAGSVERDHITGMECQGVSEGSCKSAVVDGCWMEWDDGDCTARLLPDDHDGHDHGAEDEAAEAAEAKTKLSACCNAAGANFTKTVTCGNMVDWPFIYNGTGSPDCSMDVSFGHNTMPIAQVTQYIAGSGCCENGLGVCSTNANKVCKVTSNFDAKKVAMVQCSAANESSCEALSAGECEAHWDDGECEIHGHGDLAACCTAGGHRVRDMPKCGSIAAYMFGDFTGAADCKKPSGQMHDGQNVTYMQMLQRVEEAECCGENPTACEMAELCPHDAHDHDHDHGPGMPKIITCGGLEGWNGTNCTGTPTGARFVYDDNATECLVMQLFGEANKDINITQVCVDAGGMPKDPVDCKKISQYMFMNTLATEVANTCAGPAFPMGRPPAGFNFPNRSAALNAMASKGGWGCCEGGAPQFCAVSGGDLVAKIQSTVSLSGVTAATLDETAFKNGVASTAGVGSGDVAIDSKTDVRRRAGGVSVQYTVTTTKASAATVANAVSSSNVAALTTALQSAGVPTTGVTVTQAPGVTVVPAPTPVPSPQTDDATTLRAALTGLVAVTLFALFAF